MIPRFLSFQAFGPYVKKQEIDFSGLARSGLFLISGETGAGKTAILDAIAYALFGESSGGARGGIAGMRSDFAPKDLPTEVEFRFAAGAREYKFTRTVSIRVKRNGEEEVRLSQNAFYRDETDAYRPFFENPQLRNVRQKAEEALGLTYDQFRQVILLPQGQFETMLVSDSGEKEKILSTLFHAERWERVTRWLCDTANEMKRQNDNAEAQARGVLSQFGCESIAELREKAEAQNALLPQSDAERTAAAKSAETARKKLADAALQAALFDDLDKARTRSEALDGEREKYRQIERSIARAADAAKVFPLRELAAERQREARDRGREHDAAQSRFEKAKESLERAVGGLRALLLHLCGQRGVLEAQMKRQEEEAQAAKEHRLAVFDRYIGGMAYLLAENLAEGEPCPVCGSARHVKKAEPHGEPAREEDVRHAEQQAEKAEKALRETERARAELDRDIQECEKETDRLPEAKAQELPRRGKRELLSALAAAREEENAARAIEQKARAELQKAEGGYKSAMEEYKKACGALGFENDAEVRRCGMTEEELATRGKELEAYKIDRRAAAQKRQELEERLRGERAPDTPTIEGEARRAEEDAKNAEREYARIKARADILDDAYEKIRLSWDKLERDREAYRELDTFARLLRGDMGVGLKRYVLGVMLSAVAREANHLLKLVHGGRYELFRAAEGAGRARKVGLDLQVFDRNTGEKRSVNSLSGGEKFLVSLALSLGLSSVVQAQSGGVRMDAMFIDEGFGSLDPGSIGDALSLLASVRGGSRLVGIISHVTLLQESVEASIRVEKTRWGSELRLFPPPSAT